MPLDAKNFMQYEFVHLFFHRVLLPSVWLLVRLDFVPAQMNLIVTEEVSFETNQGLVECLCTSNSHLHI